jgi:tetratricopeptide (TPR) repeat protein
VNSWFNSPDHQLTNPRIAMLALLFLLLQTAPTTAASWNEAGWKALRAGRADEAAADFAEALHRLPQSEPLVLLGAGAAANMRGHSEEAREYLAAALKAQPSLTVASLLLGEVLYRSADLNGAIGVYEQALEFAPDNRQLQSRLEAWRREAAVHDTLSTRFADHFTLLFEGPPDLPAAARVTELLESVYWQVGGALGVYPPDIVTVVLYSREQFRDITQSPSWAGGLYDGRIRIPIAGKVNERELRRVLAHEFTHVVVHSVAPRGVPQWLNEGLAMLMEDDKATPSAAPRDTPAPPLTQLEGSFEKLSPDQAAAAYTTSAAATRALIDRGGPMVIFNLLTELGAGTPFDEAFERAAFFSYRDFIGSWQDK